MNQYINKTTRSERVIIDTVMWPLICKVEQAEQMISHMRDDFFAEAEQEPINSYGAKWIGTVLQVVDDILDDVVTEYSLMMGQAKDGMAQMNLKAAESLVAVERCEKIDSAALKWILGLPENQREEAEAARQSIAALPDEKAIEALSELMKNS